MPHLTAGLSTIRHSSQQKLKNVNAPIASSWGMDETYVKVKGQWVYLYRAVDKFGANYAGIENINMLLMLAGLICFIEICQIKYLNNLIEQDHRFIKKITKLMMGFKAFYLAQATINGIETAHMIRKGQLSEENIPAYKQFMALAG